VGRVLERVRGFDREPTRRTGWAGRGFDQTIYTCRDTRFTVQDHGIKLQGEAYVCAVADSRCRLTAQSAQLAPVRERPLDLFPARSDTV
jgi:hypothetical protein